ncbi:LEA type 2 family protein [Flavihumibacter petaseus]|nr:LEA type 2 family protein [Flavihumibacter petaseus]
MSINTLRRRKQLITAVLLFLSFGLFSCSKPVIPEYQAFENFQLSKISLGETVVSADLKYYNPNPYPLQLKHADLAIRLEDKPVGTTVLDTLITIPEKDTFYIPVSLKVNMKQLLSNALTLLMQSEIDVKVDGTVKMGKSGIFFNMPVHYAGKQKIEF